MTYMLRKIKGSVNKEVLPVSRLSYIIVITSSLKYKTQTLAITIAVTISRVNFKKLRCIHLCNTDIQCARQISNYA